MLISTIKESKFGRFTFPVHSVHMKDRSWYNWCRIWNNTGTERRRQVSLHRSTIVDLNHRNPGSYRPVAEKAALSHLIRTKEGSSRIDLFKAYWHDGSSRFCLFFFSVNLYGATHGWGKIFPHQKKGMVSSHLSLLNNMRIPPRILSKPYFPGQNRVDIAPLRLDLVMTFLELKALGETKLVLYKEGRDIFSRRFNTVSQELLQPFSISQRLSHLPQVSSVQPTPHQMPPLHASRAS